jgi:hypothetical protein
MLLEKAPHTLDADEYLVFLGHYPTDWEGSFDTEIDFYMGDEEEYHLINRPTTVFIPRGMAHTPLNFRVINKPVFFGVILETPRFTKTMNGKEYAYDPRLRGII